MEYIYLWTSAYFWSGVFWSASCSAFVFLYIAVLFGKKYVVRMFWVVARREAFWMEARARATDELAATGDNGGSTACKSFISALFSMVPGRAHIVTRRVSTRLPLRSLFLSPCLCLPF